MFMHVYVCVLRVMLEGGCDCVCVCVCVRVCVYVCVFCRHEVEMGRLGAGGERCVFP